MGCAASHSLTPAELEGLRGMQLLHGGGAKNMSLPAFTLLGTTEFSDWDAHGRLSKGDTQRTLTKMQVEDADVLTQRIFEEADPTHPDHMELFDFKKVVYRVPGFTDAFAIKLYE